MLYAIQQRTGADISIPARAEQEKVVAEIAPTPAAEVVARLLNGSRFNFLILNSATDPRRLDRVILSTRTVSGEGFVPPPPQPQEQALPLTSSRCRWRISPPPVRRMWPAPEPPADNPQNQ